MLEGLSKQQGERGSVDGAKYMTTRFSPCVVDGSRPKDKTQSDPLEEMHRFQRSTASDKGIESKAKVILD